MHWEKIRDDKKWNFQIMTNGEWKSTGHEYDFQSVMHYSSKNFAKDGVGPTMTRRVSNSHVHSCPDRSKIRTRPGKNGSSVSFGP